MLEFDIAAAQAAADWRADNRQIAALLSAVANSPLFKGAILIALGLAAVAGKGKPLLLARDGFLLRFAGTSVLAIFIGRLLQLGLPFRERTLINLFAVSENSAFARESSFPSDHAVYMTAMAVSIFTVDRKLGVAALIWTTLVILLPRFLLNYHYPTDLLAGAALGAVIAAIVMRARAPQGVKLALARAEQRSPEIVYPICFLFGVAAATNFEAARAAVSGFIELF